MTSLRERLERKIESEATRCSLSQCSTGQYDLDKAISWYLKVGFEEGAQSMLDLVCELAEALGKAKGAMGYAYEDRSDQYYLNVKQDLEEALQAIEKFVEGEK